MRHLGDITEVKDFEYRDSAGNVVRVKPAAQSSALLVATIPALGTNDTFVFNNTGATLQNKTIPVGSSNNVMGIDDTKAGYLNTVTQNVQNFMTGVTTMTGYGGAKGTALTALTAAELGYLSGVTSAIQTQFSANTSAHSSFSGRLTALEDIVGGTTPDSATVELTSTPVTDTSSVPVMYVIKTLVGAGTYNLRATPLAGTTYQIANKASGSLTIDGNSKTIDGTSTYILAENYSVLLRYNGTNWTVMNEALSPTSVTLTLTANSNGITAGNVVELVSTGGQDVQNIYHVEAPTISSLATLDGTNNVSGLVISPTSTNTAIIGWYSGGNGNTSHLVQAQVGNNGLLTIGSQTNTSTNADYGLNICTLTPTVKAISFGQSGAFGKIGTQLVFDNGTNGISLSSQALLVPSNASNNSNIYHSVCALTSSNWFVAYADTNHDYKILTAVSNGTNGPTPGTAAGSSFGGTNDPSYLSLGRLTDTTALLGYQYINAGYVHRILSNGTNAATISAPVNLDGTNNCTYITQSPIDSNHTLCAYNNATTSNGCLAVIQANGTNAPTVISRAVFETNNISYTGLTQHSSAAYGLVYRNYSPYEARTRVIEVDLNYNITMTTYTRINGTNNNEHNAIAALSSTQSIVAGQDLTTSTGFAGTLTLTPTPIISGQLVGIAETSATNGADATVCVGPVYATTNSLTAGSDYYASGSGGLTTNVTPIHVGKAESTNTMLLDLRGAPEAGKQLVWEITTPGAFTWTAPYDGEYEITFCGGGGSGGSGSGYYIGGNGGDTVHLTKKLSKNSSISGSVGAGGAAVGPGGGAGNVGTASSLVINGLTYIASGGKGGYLGASPKYINYPNTLGAGNIGNLLYGTLGMNVDGASLGGAAPLLTRIIAVESSSTGMAGTRGGGGTTVSSSYTSGKGGDGVVSITLILGS